MFHLFNHQFSIIEIIIFILILGVSGYIFYIMSFHDYDGNTEMFEWRKKEAILVAIVQVAFLAVWMLWGE